VKLITKLLKKTAIFCLGVFALIAIIKSKEIQDHLIFYHASSKMLKPFSTQGGSGTAFLAKSRAGKTYVVTNYHVCMGTMQQETSGAANDPKRLTVKLEHSLDEEKITTRSVLLLSIENDVCILEAKEEEEGLSLVESFSPNQKIYVLGHPLGQQLQLTFGNIINKKSIIVGQPIPVPFFGMAMIPIMYKAFSMHVDALPGNSGSPILNQLGQVVGILFAGDRRSTNSPYGIPAKNILDMMDLLK
jgi:S1-C subfamily serine protease